MSIGLIGKKIGMTRVYDDKGKLRPVPSSRPAITRCCVVKTKENDGYSALQLGFDRRRNRA